MRLLGTPISVALCSTIMAAIAVAQQFTIANVTSCGLSCLAQTAPEINCSLLNTTCQCSSTTLSALTAECMFANCTMHDTLVLSKVQATTCNLSHANRSLVPIIVVTTVVGVLSFIVPLRFLSRPILKIALGAEDYIIFGSLLMAAPTTILTILISRQGFGRHIWDLQEGDLLRFLKNFYIAENIYVWELSLTKISILFFYLRIFSAYKTFKRLVFLTIFLIFLSTTIISLLTIFSCSPISYFWNKDLKGGAKCININALAYANSVSSITQDILVIALPIPVIWGLNMEWKKKWAVCFMFGVGGCGFIISVLRLQSLLSFGNSIDPSWDYVNVTIWTILELAMAIICACLPSIRQLLTHLYPRIFSTITDKSSPPASSSSSSSSVSRSKPRTTSGRRGVGSNRGGSSGFGGGRGGSGGGGQNGKMGDFVELVEWEEENEGRWIGNSGT